MAKFEQPRHNIPLSSEEQLVIAVELEKEDQLYRTGQNKEKYQRFQELLRLNKIKDQAELERLKSETATDSRLQEMLVLYNEMRDHDVKLQLRVEDLLTKSFGSKFPSLLESPSQLVNAIWLIFQHGDEEFLEKGLRLMLESKKRNVINVEMWRIMQMADRLCLFRFGYGLFGTQGGSETVNNLIPKNLGSNFLNQIQVLVSQPIPVDKRQLVSALELSIIWQKAKLDPALALSNSGMVDYYINKFS